MNICSLVGTYMNNIKLSKSLTECVYSHRERMKLPYMAEQFEQMMKISSEFVRLQVSHDEYLCMKVLLLLSTGQTLALELFSQM